MSNTNDSSIIPGENETATAFGVWSAPFAPFVGQRVRIRATYFSNATPGETGRIVRLATVNGFCAATVELDNGQWISTAFGLDVEPFEGGAETSDSEPEPTPTPTTVAEFEFECGDSPGGFIASYGAGVALTDFDEIYFGYGRSEREAAENAIESYATGAPDPDKWAMDRMEEAAGDLDDSETACEEFETECFEEFCRERGLGDSDWTDEHLQEFQDSMESVEIVAVLRVRYGEPETVEECIARHFDVSLDEVVGPGDGATHFYGAPMFEVDGAEFVVATESEADSAVRQSIEDSLFAFRPDFVASHCPNGIDSDTIEAIVGERCEDANDAIRALIEAGNGLDAFIDDAVLADGRGHFLAHYDGDEIEIDGPDGETLFAFRIN